MPPTGVKDFTTSVLGTFYIQTLIWAHIVADQSCDPLVTKENPRDKRMHPGCFVFGHSNAPLTFIFVSLCLVAALLSQ